MTQGLVLRDLLLVMSNTGVGKTNLIERSQSLCRGRLLFLWGGYGNLGW